MEELLRGLAPRTTLPILTNDFLNSFLVAVPPMEEQARVVADLERHWRLCKFLSNRITRQVARLYERRHALITAAVSGRSSLAGSGAECVASREVRERITLV